MCTYRFTISQRTRLSVKDIGAPFRSTVDTTLWVPCKTDTKYHKHPPFSQSINKTEWFLWLWLRTLKGIQSNYLCIQKDLECSKRVLSYQCSLFWREYRTIIYLTMQCLFNKMAQWVLLSFGVNSLQSLCFLKLAYGIPPKLCSAISANRNNLASTRVPAWELAMGELC